MLQAQLGRSPDKRIPAALLAKAKCVALFPDVIQGGFIYGGKFGNGVVSCRHEATNEWGAPVFVAMGGASIGAQVGLKKADIILLAMTNKGLNQLLSGKPIVGGEASLAAGPVGRDATVNMDVLLRTPLIGYSRSQGLFAGFNLEGVAIRSSKKINKELYGEYQDIRELLMQRLVSPASVSKIREALRLYATGSEELS
jgi:lipid-binding SYLF domain-containing protein